MGLLSKFKGSVLGALAAPLTGGLSLAAGYLYDTNKQQNEANQKAVDRANAYDMYTWDLANQYNDPKSQMERLKAAGLNPNLVYGSGNVTGNTTGQAGSNGIAQQEVFNGVSKGIQFAQAAANLQNTVANNKLLQYQMEKTDADRLYTEAQTTNLNNFLKGSGNSTYTYGIDSNLTFKDSHPSLLNDPVAYVVDKAGKIPGVAKQISDMDKVRSLSDKEFNDLMDRARYRYELLKYNREHPGKFRLF